MIFSTIRAEVAWLAAFIFIIFLPLSTLIAAPKINVEKLTERPHTIKIRKIDGATKSLTCFLGFHGACLPYFDETGQPQVNFEELAIPQKSPCNQTNGIHEFARRNVLHNPRVDLVECSASPQEFNGHTQWLTGIEDGKTNWWHSLKAVKDSQSNDHFMVSGANQNGIILFSQSNFTILDPMTGKILKEISQRQPVNPSFPHLFPAVCDLELKTLFGFRPIYSGWRTRGELLKCDLLSKSCTKLLNSKQSLIPSEIASVPITAMAMTSSARYLVLAHDKTFNRGAEVLSQRGITVYDIERDQIIYSESLKTGPVPIEIAVGPNDHFAVAIENRRGGMIYDVVHYVIG